MLQKNIILIISFITLAFIISLFPPYSWGDEKLKTERERQRINYYYENNLPFKQYDFLFNDIRKEFKIGNNKITLERHLIVSELIIQIFLAFLVSILIQFLYRKYSYSFLLILSPILIILVGVIIILSSFNLFAPWFQPSYSAVEIEKGRIKNLYSAYLESYSIDEIISIFNNLQNDDRNNWDYETKEFWSDYKNSIQLDTSKYRLPEIEKYLTKKTEKKSRLNFDLSDLYKDDIEKEFPFYKNYTPPEGYKVDYNSLDTDIEIIRYKIFSQSISEIPKYLKIKKQYFTDFQNYWDFKVPQFKYYTVITFIIIVLIFFILKRKKLLLKLKNV
jgi:hypothetical protein